MQSTIYVQKHYTTGYIPYTSPESLHEFESISLTRNNYLVVQVLPQIIEFRSYVAAATRWTKSGRVVGSNVNCKSFGVSSCGDKCRTGYYVAMLVNPAPVYSQ